MKKSGAQSGFAAVEAILVLIIIGILGFTGWFVWHAKQNADRSLKNAANSSQPVIKSKKSVSTAQPPASISSASANYLIVKEWGLKLTFADADKVTYATPAKCSDDPSDKTQCTGLSLKASVTAVKDCQPLGLSITQSPTYAEMKATTKVGNFYYGIGGAPGPCGGTASVDQLRAKIASQEIGKGDYKLEAE